MRMQPKRLQRLVKRRIRARLCAPSGSPGFILSLSSATGSAIWPVVALDQARPSAQIDFDAVVIVAAFFVEAECCCSGLVARRFRAAVFAAAGEEQKIVNRSVS